MLDVVRISDAHGVASAAIAPTLGFNCVSFQSQVHEHLVDVLDSPPQNGEPRPSGFGIPLLFPFPNRIQSGKFSWDGRDYSVPLSAGRPHAIHGFCLDKPWRIVRQESDLLQGQFQLSLDAPDRAQCWPADFILNVRYHVTGGRLDCRFRISNPDDRPLPWGLGTHPYFRVPPNSSSKPEFCVFSVPVSEEWELVEKLPTGKRTVLPPRDPLSLGERFGQRTFDHAYTGWEIEAGAVRTSIMDEKAGIEIMQICDARYFRDVVVYTPPGRNALCLEPYTCVTDAINLQGRGVDAGLQVLPPGESVETWITIQAGPVIA